MKRKILSYLLVALLLLAAALIYCLQSFELSSDATAHAIHFSHQGHELEGTLLVPAGRTRPPVALLVHGDGAQDRWSSEGYVPLVNDLLARGIAVFSWDKPGVGGSQGNWLSQTMEDRADEAAQALKRLRNEPSLAKSTMGFLGFSQAGWVVPQASHSARADFAVLVGPAINWRDQSLYYLRQRLALLKRPADEITAAEQQESASYATVFTATAASLPCMAACTREDFERRNAHSDARRDIAAMNTPIMILMGKQDRNVDPEESVGVWTALLPATTPRCIGTLPAAMHGLLRSAWFDYQLTSDWPWYTVAVFLASGRHSYAPGALESVSAWILERKCPFENRLLP